MAVDVDMANVFEDLEMFWVEVMRMLKCTIAIVLQFWMYDK